MDLGPDSRDPAALVDEKGRALDPEVFSAVQVLFLPDPVGFRDSALIVAQQRKVEVIFVPELYVARGIVPTHPKHDRPFRLDATEVVPETAGLFRAPWCVILRVEVQDDLLPSKFLERYRPSVVGAQAEVRRRFTNRGHGHRRLVARVRPS